MNPRSIILLTLAVVVPAGALAVLGLILLGQQQEVVRLRQQDRDLLAARVAADSLANRLERAAARSTAALEDNRHAIYPHDDSLVFLGRIDEEAYVPPYRREMSSSLADPDFQRWLLRHRRLELQGASVSRRLTSLRRETTDETQATYLRFLTGQTLLADGRREEAEAVLAPIVSTPFRVTDEFGIPIALYAADLLQPEELPFAGEWLGPVAAAYLQDLDSLRWRDEYALLRNVRPIAPGIDGWRSLNGNWLVGRVGDMVFGVRMSQLARFLPEAQIRPASAAGLSMAPVFPDLALRPTDSSSPVTGLWAAALLLTVFLSAVAGLLLIRDQRREKRLAALRSRFVSSVSHEVRTPLSAIRLYTESLLTYGPGEDENAWRDDLQTIARETGRLTRMLDNVLTFSRVERGTQKYTLAPGRLDRVLEATAKVMQPALAESGCELHTDLTPVEAEFDADGIQQAVVNLLSNAAKYASGTRVQLSCAERGGEARIVVSDAGPGIREADAERIFEPYFRANGNAETGTGLGLAIVQHVAAAHSGEARLSSIPGQGSQFTISFPLTP